MHFEILRDLSAAPYGGSDMGEVLEAASQIVPGDYESFYSAFYAIANRLNATASQIDSTLFPVSARDAFFRASTYYRSADFYLHGNQSDPRINSLWIQQANAFNAGLKLLPVPGRRVTLQADNFTIPAIYYPASHEPTPSRPTIIMGSGYDGGQEELFHQAVRPALERGYNVITYEGPGQATVVREQHLGFIAEWEKVVTPVVDYLFTLPEVDKTSVALVGFSFGGLLAPRAAAFEYRLVATVALDGLSEFGSLALQKFPTPMAAAFNSSNATAFNSAIEKALASPDTGTQLKWFIEQGMWSSATTDPFTWMTQIQAFSLANVIDKIQGPVFVADAQDDLFFLNQGKILADSLGNRSVYYDFLEADGAGQHAGVGSFVKQAQVFLDWIQGVLDAKS